ncbi:hypothetical protein MA16_Dca024812 [Dendrobium catenatum]|uniref:Uncharacterized protein n=1 Tax=Dendrobium catenatum TaxID=906689 RepID=A0A2I0XCW6_9ASPA|nr:hypothetical protein MA16_Dca024812 [Dendrobium catenatum]
MLSLEVNSGEVIPSGPVSPCVELVGCGVSSPVSKSEGVTTFINVPISVMSNDDAKTHVAKFRNNSVRLQMNWIILDDSYSSQSDREDVLFDEEVLASRIVDQICHNLGGKNCKSKAIRNRLLLLILLFC